MIRLIIFFGCSNNFLVGSKYSFMHVFQIVIANFYRLFIEYFQFMLAGWLVGCLGFMAYQPLYVI